MRSRWRPPNQPKKSSTCSPVQTPRPDTASDQFPLGKAFQAPDVQPVPTTPASVAAQTAAALDPNHPRAAVLQVPGEVPPDLGGAGIPVPAGDGAHGVTRPTLVPVVTEQGTAWVNPAKIDPAAAKAQFDQPNGGGTLLGMASETRPEDPNNVVTTRDASGTPVLDEAITDQTVEAAIEKAQQSVPPGGTVEVNSPEDVMAERRMMQPELVGMGGAVPGEFSPASVSDAITPELRTGMVQAERPGGVAHADAIASEHGARCDHGQEPGSEGRGVCGAPGVQGLAGDGGRQDVAEDDAARSGDGRVRRPLCSQRCSGASGSAGCSRRTCSPV